MNKLRKLRHHRESSSPHPCPPSEPTAIAAGFTTVASTTSRTTTRMLPTGTSRTLYYAQQGSAATLGTPAKPEYVTGVAPKPDSSIAHYWAARAVTAEVLLAERHKHTDELRSVMYGEDVKRRTEVAALQEVHEEHQKKMERMVLCCVAALAITIFGLLVTHVLHTPTPLTSTRRTASHFTIPILSPFTSVVEHETSAWGARIIVPALIIVSTFAWGVVRHWMTRGSRR
ncbi:hypothetical protein B0F90DRAFT_1821770 [Multifurca ochricompacta]|uniref:Uncharacterized protein n=1 Tax=Multifurca ochricompacta TaxID=376703 RepID=A0AAD4QK88_9AGAM|nr:hypothetical protein B0F90DRAFT_1821770 [Multifurca ochricompacta]